MRRIMNFLLTMFVLWFSSENFTSVYINSTKTLILATVLMFAISIIFGYIVMLSVLLTPILIGCLPLIISIIIAPFMTIIELLLLDKYLVGFHIQGFWTYVLISVVLSIFSVRVSASKNEVKA